MNIAMSYANYDSVIRFAHKVELRGWPGSIRFATPLTITSLTEIKILRGALISGECAWVVMGRDEYAKVFEKVKEKPTKGRATWSNKGKKRGPQVAEGKHKRTGGDDQQSEVEKENAAVDKDLM